MNDFVMMAIFVVVPLLGGIGMYLIVKEDEMDNIHKGTTHNLDTDSERPELRKITAHVANTDTGGQCII